MQNQTNMHVFQKLDVVRGRNERSGSIVSDDALDDNGDDFCYHRHNSDCDTEMVDDLVGGTVVIDGNDTVSMKKNFGNNIGSSSLSLYGRRRKSNSMAVVTSTRFDSDDSFSEAARAMIHRYEHQNMSEVDAINGTLRKADDLRTFIEALDLRFTVLGTKMEDDKNMDSDDALSELLLKTRSIFDATLKAMWREIDLSSTSPTTTLGSYTWQQHHRREIASDLDEYICSRHPKTPKNLRMSPMLMSNFNYNNHGIICQSESIDSTCSEGSNCSIFRSFKRRRRWFFPQNNKNERGVVTPSPSVASSSSGSVHKPFPINSSLPKFYFNFGGSSNNCTNSNKNFSRNTSLVFGDTGGTKRVHSLRLDDGLESSQTSMGDRNGIATYMPPTSPIRKVSIEMRSNDCATTHY